MTGEAAQIVETCRLYVLITLVAAAVGKARAAAPFISATAALLGLSPRAAPPVAYAVIAAEASIALLLLAGGAAGRIGMAAALLLFLAFTLVLAAALARRTSVHCNCFGGHGHRISGHDLLRNASLIAAAIVFLAGHASRAPASPMALALHSGVALILLLVFANSRDILALSRQS